MGRLGRCFTPGQVYFSISIDTHDYSTTKKLLHPVLQYFPRLRECAIRLKLDPEHQKDTEHHRMQSLAETTALKLLHSHERADTFPFLKLPLELRHLVLEQLPSLATQRSSGGIGVTQIFEPFTRHCYHYADHPYEVFDHLARDFYSCCGKCNNRRGATTGCFCREIGISYSSTCVCDRMEPLLKINRQLNYEVREFLFSRNIIRLADSNWHAMNIKTFLRTLPRTLLPRINKLELIVSYYNYKRWITDEEEKDATEDVVRDTIVEKCDWPSLIRFIRYNMSVERMDLYIKLPDSFYHWYKGTWQNDEKYWPHWQKAYHIQYQALLDSLQQLQTLRRFFVYFGDCDWEELDVDSETKIEKLVMGDHYDSSKSGKPEFPCTEFDDNMA